MVYQKKRNTDLSMALQEIHNFKVGRHIYVNGEFVLICLTYCSTDTG